MPEPRRIAVFEFSHFGHHPYYLRLLVEHCRSRRTPLRLDIVVTPRFAAEHGDLVALAAATAEFGVTLATIAPEEEDRLESAAAPLAVPLDQVFGGVPDPGLRATVQWELVARHAVALRADRALLMHLDPCLVPLARWLPLPCPLSGILFKPSFHYGDFHPGAAGDRQELQRVQERLLLGRALRHPRLHTLFCLDPIAAARLSGGAGKVVALGDPVPGDPISDVAGLRRDFGVEPGRRVLLFFGNVEERKGIFPLLEALPLLPAATQRQACLLLVGAVADGDRGRLAAALSSARGHATVQLVQRSGYVPESLVPAVFDLADVVVAPYRRHVGMSGVMLRAAAHFKPIVTQDYGLIGHLVGRHRLGLAVDTTRPAAIAEALQRALSQTTGLFDAAAARLLLADHLETRFAETLLSET